MSVPAMTYDSLVQNIIDFSERDDPDFVAQIPNLILLAEYDIATQVKTLWELTPVETTLTVGLQGATVLKPARWRKTVSMSINGQPVMHRSQDYVKQVQYESSPSQPIYYSDYDYNHWAIAPIPDQAYPVEITYYSLLQPLSEDNQENLITREAPQALLYGTLLQAQGYLKALDKIAIWKQYYTDIMSALLKENAGRNVDRNTSVQEPQ
jgi:hypothetical protein